MLAGQTKGYRHHPQLIRFRAHPKPLAAICEYLRWVLEESRKRGFHFDETKLHSRGLEAEVIKETRGQLAYEWQHLLNKLRVRDPEGIHRLTVMKTLKAHPLYRIVRGEIRDWEHIS